MKKNVLFIFILATLVGCNTTSNTSNSESTRNYTISTFAPNKTYVDLHIHSTCPVSEEKEQKLAPELLAAIVPSLIDTVVGSVTNAVKKAGEDSVFKLSAHNGEEYFYKFDAVEMQLEHNDGVGCIIVSIHDSGLEVNLAKTASTNIDKEKQFHDQMQMWTSGGGTAKTPKFYAELAIEKDNREGLFRLVPSLVFMKHGLKENDEDETMSKKTLLAFDFRKPGDSSDTATFGAVLLAMQGLEYNKVYTKPELDTFKSVWMTLPSPSEAVKTKLASIKTNNALINTHQQAECKAMLQIKPEDAAKFCNSRQWGNGAPMDFAEYQQLMIELNQANEDKLNAELALALDNGPSDAGKAVIQEAHDFNRIQSKQQILDPIVGLSSQVVSLKNVNSSISSSLINSGRFELHLEVAETTPGSKFMKTLGQILEGSQDSLTTVLKNKFDPATKETNAETAAAEAEQKLVNIYELNKQLEEAKLTLSSNQLKLSAAKTEEEKLTAASAIAVAQLTINEITRKLANLSD